MSHLLWLPVPLWLAGVAYLLGVVTLPALLSAVWLYDARRMRHAAERDLLGSTTTGLRSAEGGDRKIGAVALAAPPSPEVVAMRAKKEAERARQQARWDREAACKRDGGHQPGPYGICVGCGNTDYAGW